MILINKTMVTTTTPETHRLHRMAFDTDVYFAAATLLPGETEADFEEVPLAEVPAENVDE